MADKDVTPQTKVKDVAAAADPGDESGFQPDPVTEQMVKDGVRAETGGTTQREPKPEDFPASAKVAPPAEQLNSALSQVIGHAAPPEQGQSSLVDSDSIAKGAQDAEARQAEVRERTAEEFERRAEYDRSVAA